MALILILISLGSSVDLNVLLSTNYEKNNCDGFLQHNKKKSYRILHRHDIIQITIGPSALYSLAPCRASSSSIILASSFDDIVLEQTWYRTVRTGYKITSKTISEEVIRDGRNKSRNKVTKHDFQIIHRET